MIVEKAILAVITTNRQKVDGGAPVFICDDEQEMQMIASNLEAIMDGIAHALGDDVIVIVKHG